MRTLHALAPLLLVAAVGCGADDDGGGGGGADEPADLAGITAAHNAVRAEVGVGQMTWNNDLAALATGFIADCVFAHSDGAERENQAGFDYVGENLYWAKGFQPTGVQVSDRAGPSGRTPPIHRRTRSCSDTPSGGLPRPYGSADWAQRAARESGVQTAARTAQPGDGRGSDTASLPC